MISLSTFMKAYRVGDIVDIKNNGAQQKGMAFKVYHGKTGVVYKRHKIRCWGYSLQAGRQSVYGEGESLQTLQSSCEVLTK